MDGNPQLLTDVKFSTHRKGYDPDEVDNFLERVSTAVAQLQDKLRQATDRAETADAKVAEARRLQADAEAALEAAGGHLDADGQAVAPGEGDDELKKVLVLAQRAADQAVEEANATATRTVADARATAVNLLAEAEAERDRMLAKARKKADAAAEERARELHEQVATLDRARGDLQADVEALEGYLGGERDRLRRQLGEISRIVEDPGALSLLAAPQLSGTEVPELVTEAEPEPEPDGRPADDHTIVAAEGEAPTGYLGPEGIDESSSLDPVASTSSTEAGATPDGDARPADTQPDGDEVESDAEPSGAEVESIDLTNERLFGEGESGIDAGPPTALFDTLGDPSSSPLGEPDEEADAAMRAFFERDLDDDSDAKSSRFGRRR
jgi:DivIVA domain-containing protein